MIIQVVFWDFPSSDHTYDYSPNILHVYAKCNYVLLTRAIMTICPYCTSILHYWQFGARITSPPLTNMLWFALFPMTLNLAILRNNLRHYPVHQYLIASNRMYIAHTMTLSHPLCVDNVLSAPWLVHASYIWLLFVRGTDRVIFRSIELTTQFRASTYIAVSNTYV